jgi:uncharacterized protein
VEKDKATYQIPIKGLAVGEHHYDYVVEDTFFEQYGGEEMHRGKINLSLDIEKESRLMTMMFRFEGYLQLVCDRCLEEYEQPLRGDFNLIVKYGDKSEEISDELITIPFDTSRFDIAPYIAEFVRLMVPFKHVHPDDEQGHSTCNAEMLKKLEMYEKPAPDPRWNALKDLKIE